MVESSFRVRVLTENGVQFDGEAVSVVAPGAMGFLGILANHAPLLTTLTAGPMTVRLPTAPGAAQAGRPQQATTRFRVGEGLLEVFRNQVTVVTDRWSPHA